MIGTAIKSITIVALVLLSFAAGWFGREYRLLDGPRYTLTQPLAFSSVGGAANAMPPGITFYHYRTLGEIATFVVFVNTKRLDALRAESGGPAFHVIPVEVH